MNGHLILEWQVGAVHVCHALTGHGERRFAEVGSEVGVLAGRFCPIPGVNDEINETKPRKSGNGHLAKWHRHHPTQHTGVIQRRHHRVC